MSKQSTYLALVVVGSIVTVVLALFLFRGKSGGGNRTHASVVASNAAGSSPTSSAAQRGDATNTALVKQGLEAIFEGLKQAGAKEVTPVANRLRDAVDSKDHAKVTYAFHEAIYDTFAKMSVVLPAIREYLAHADPFVRYSAAQALARAGDPAGSPALLAIVRASAPLPEGAQDLRVEAARVLGKFREEAAGHDVVALYKSTSGSGLLTALATLGEKEIIPELEQRGFNANEYSVIRYGMIEANSFIPKIAATFTAMGTPEFKNAAAWALARMTGDKSYVNYLADAAQPAIEAAPNGGEQRFDQSAAALKYLGSLQDPKAIQTLESALRSQNPVAVQYAVVNLLFNQPDSSERPRRSCSVSFAASNASLAQN
jgi:HEAT repeat protein